MQSVADDSLLESGFEIFEAVWATLRARFETQPTSATRSTAESGVAAQLQRLFAPALEAANRPAIRQVLGEIVLSREFGAVEQQILSEFWSPDRKQALPPVVLDPRSVATLGTDVAAMLTRSLARSRRVAEAFIERTSEAELRKYAELDPIEIARVRHDLILGDILPSRHATKLLNHMRAQVAIIALLVVAAQRLRVPAWTTLALAELADAGTMEADELFLSDTPFDVAREIASYAEYKDQLFERILRGEVVDVDALGADTTS